MKNQAPIEFGNCARFVSKGKPQLTIDKAEVHIVILCAQKTIKGYNIQRPLSYVYLYIYIGFCILYFLFYRLLISLN